MKHLLVLLTILSILVMTACHQSTNNSQPSAQPSSTEPTYYTITDSTRENFGPYLDLDRTHKPSEEDILSITQGMHITEVVALLGKPHWLTGSPMPIFIWQSAEGQYYSLQCSYEDDAPKDLRPVERAIKHSVVITKVASTWPPKTNPSTPTEPPTPTDPSDPTAPTEIPTQDSTFHQPDDPMMELPDPDVYLYYDSFDALFANLKDDAKTMVDAGNPFFNTITTDNSFWQAVQNIPAFEKHLIDEVGYVYVDNFAPRKQGFQQLRLRLHPIENCGNSPFHTSCVSYIVITYNPNEGFPSIYTELPLYYSKISREPETYVRKFDSGNLTYAFKFTDTLYVELFIDNYNESIEPIEDAMLEYVRQLYNVAPDHFK